MTVARLLAAAASVVLATACGAAAVAEPEPLAPPTLLDAGAAAGLAFAADDARRLAYLRNDPAPLADLYAPDLLKSEAARLSMLAARGTALEETVAERAVVHSRADAGRSQVVLAVRGQSRRLAVGGQARPWSTFFRQTAFDINFTAGRWLVEGVQDLAPGSWWK